MDEKRKGEIALALVKYILRERGVTLSQGHTREIGNISKATGVSVEELKQFAKPLFQEVLDGCFAAKLEN